MIQKSPGGSVFPYYYKGGFLFGVHYGSFFDDEERLLERMKAEEGFITNSIRQTPIWIDFYESRLGEKVLVEFINSVFRMQAHITKLAIVGCSSKDRRRLTRALKRPGVELALPVRFFSDPEEAKTWLVSESS